jgi:adenylyltransferase/sulfurtransferase
MNDQQLLRYSRHIALPQIGIEGQQKLLDSSVLIVGLGGLGSPAALYLAAAGVGTLMIADFDRVELSNLQRQILHGTENLGDLKTDSAMARLQSANPEVRVVPVVTVLDEDSLPVWIAQADVVIDGSDNFATRFALNRACVKYQKPLVSGAVIRMEGQVAVFDLRIPDSPCYACLYREGEELGESCSETGVLAPVTGIVGSIQATETLKLLIGLPTLTGRLLVLDALTQEWRSLKLRKDPACAVCASPRP